MVARILSGVALPVRYHRGLFGGMLLSRRLAVHAGVAQLVEQRIRNAKVTSSTPVTGTRHLQQGPGLGFGQALRLSGLQAAQRRPGRAGASPAPRARCEFARWVVF